MIKTLTVKYLRFSEHGYGVQLNATLASGRKISLPVVWSHADFSGPQCVQVQQLFENAVNSLMVDVDGLLSGKKKRR